MKGGLRLQQVQPIIFGAVIRGGTHCHVPSVTCILLDAALWHNGTNPPMSDSVSWS